MAQFPNRMHDLSIALARHVRPHQLIAVWMLAGGECLNGPIDVVASVMGRLYDRGRRMQRSKAPPNGVLGKKSEKSVPKCRRAWTDCEAIGVAD